MLRSLVTEDSDGFEHLHFLLGLAVHIRNHPSAGNQRHIWPLRALFAMKGHCFIIIGSARTLNFVCGLLHVPVGLAVQVGRHP